MNRTSARGFTYLGLRSSWPRPKAIDRGQRATYGQNSSLEYLDMPSLDQIAGSVGAEATARPHHFTILGSHISIVSVNCQHHDGQRRTDSQDITIYHSLRSTKANSLSEHNTFTFTQCPATEHSYQTHNHESFHASPSHSANVLIFALLTTTQ